MALDIKRFTVRFVEEARDHLRRMEDGMRALEAAPADQETINTIFRSAHTIKGSSRMLKLTAINTLAHKLEDVLGAVREGGLVPAPALISLLQRAVDTIAAQVEQVADGRDVAEAEAALISDLAKAMNGDSVGSAPPSPTPAPDSTSVDVRVKSPDTVRIPLGKLDEVIKLMGEVVSTHGRLRQRVADLRELERRVQAGEYRCLHDFAHALRDDVQHQELLMEELLGKALIMRMLPLSVVFESAPRMVRDLARSIGKDVTCVVSGQEIELDRQLIDRLGDPLVHLLRNAVDHGIEDPATREAKGKPRRGQVRISARQDGGGVVIEVGDDGAGLPLEAIRDKAVRKGVMSAEQAAALSEAEVIDLIFLPGFSTNAIITDVSGRGVGMDVVKSCIVDDLQGGISVETRSGGGTTFSLRLPLSLAVMRLLLVDVGGQTVGFTGQQVSQIVRVPSDHLLTVAERPVVVVHNEFIPVARLAELLSLPSGTGPEPDAVLLVVVAVRGEKLALRIDDLIDERDMVIKPLPEHLRHLPLVSGLVVTGRNALVSVLHAPALVDAARRVRGESHTTAGSSTDGAGGRVLIVDDSLNTREIERDVLEAYGYQVTLAEDGVDGLNKARAGTFDAILTDVEMPNMDGFSLTASLRQDERYRDTPIIIITSREKEEDKRRGIQVGANAYIVKGDFNQSNLLDTLRSLIG